MFEGFRFVAFDPGVAGAYSLWSEGRLLRVVSMPESDIDIIRDLVAFWPHMAVVESVHASPVMGSSKAFRFGREYQRVLSLSYAVLHHTCVVTVPPAQWQAATGLLKTDKGCDTYSEKKRSITSVAKTKYPHHGITKSTADAVMLGEFLISVLTPQRVARAIALHSFSPGNPNAETR